MADQKQEKPQTVRVSVRYPHTHFEHQLKDVPVIDAEGVEVPANKLDQLRKLARELGVPLSVSQQGGDS